MIPRSKAEWIEYYCQKTGSEGLELNSDELVLFHPEHGFIAYAIDKEKKILHSHYTCGDGKYWQKVYFSIMEQNGLRKLLGYTERNPKAWMRKYGGKIKGYYMEVDIDELRD